MNQTADLEALMPERDAEGYLIDPENWNEAVAQALAQEENIELNADHWDTIRFMRDYFEEHQVIARVGQSGQHVECRTSDQAESLRGEAGVGEHRTCQSLVLCLEVDRCQDAALGHTAQKPESRNAGAGAHFDDRFSLQD